jgi:DNA-directed RNA polymerase specialized sigma subunit
MTVPSLSEIQRLHAQVQAGKAASSERDRMIRELAGAGTTQAEIAEAIGVARQRIGQIVGKTT